MERNREGNVDDNLRSLQLAAESLESFEEVGALGQMHGVLESVGVEKGVRRPQGGCRGGMGSALPPSHSKEETFLGLD